jgi:SAM-dependent methyltransferase
MSAEPERSLLEREADHWDRQEEALGDLYARPHDWKFALELADRIVEPKLRHLRRLFDAHRHEIGSVLDIGCGNGWFCNGIARERGIRAFGVDLSAKKIEAARAEAERDGVAHLTAFHAGDVMGLELPEKVDLLTAQGSLHHFPGLEDLLPRMVERYLRPGGLMLFVEPHHEGMPPGLAEWMLKTVHRPWIGRLFDLEFYEEIQSQNEREDPDAGEHAVRIESPAGRDFLGDEPDMGEILKSRYELIDERYFFYAVGHLANLFYIYMKSRPVRWLFRHVALGPLIAIDNRLLRSPGRQRWANEGSWLLRGPG